MGDVEPLEGGDGEVGGYGLGEGGEEEEEEGEGKGEGHGSVARRERGGPCEDRVGRRRVGYFLIWKFIWAEMGMPNDAGRGGEVHCVHMLRCFSRGSRDS